MKMLAQDGSTLQNTSGNWSQRNVIEMHELSGEQFALVDRSRQLPAGAGLTTDSNSEAAVSTLAVTSGDELR